MKQILHIQPWAFVLMSAPNSLLPDAVRDFCRERLPQAHFVRGRALGIEVSDDPQSREARSAVDALILRQAAPLVRSGQTVVV